MNLRTVTPIAATILLVLTWGSGPPVVILIVDGVFLAASVLAAVHHAEVIAHRVGEPFGSLVLAPETLAAVRNAARGRVQTSSNLALGSAMASIGLTIPAIAVASIWLAGPLILGLDSTQIVLLVITAIVGALTVLPGRATVQEGGVHLVLFGAFVFLAFNP